MNCNAADHVPILFLVASKTYNYHIFIIHFLVVQFRLTYSIRQENPKLEKLLGLVLELKLYSNSHIKFYKQYTFQRFFRNQSSAITS